MRKTAMSDALNIDLQDDTLSTMRASRGRPSVLKMQFAQFRSQGRIPIIFAFEGDDDKIVYHHWIKRLYPDLDYEPYVCNGKSLVFQLMDIIDRDLTGIGEGVFFFVDRDFDDLRGRSPDNRLFVTDMYSVENYLVCDDVLRSLLKNEFHCSDIRTRETICKKFSEVYDGYIKHTSCINERISFARQAHVKIHVTIPDRLQDFFNFDLKNAFGLSAPSDEIIKYDVEYDEIDWLAHRVYFRKLDPRRRYRGKFHLNFFLKWLTHLAEDHKSSDSYFFSNGLRAPKVRRTEFVLSSFSARSPTPYGLADFLRAVSRLPCEGIPE
jgi:hypothetical protein